MQSKVQYKDNDKNGRRGISDILLIPRYQSNKSMIMVYAEQVEQAESENWEIGNIVLRQQVIIESLDIFIEIDITDKVLFTNGSIIFLADVIETFDNGFRIKKCMPALEIWKLEEKLRTEIESAIRKKKALSIIHNKEDVYNLSNGLVLVDEELHINIYTEAEFYLLDDLIDLLSGIKEILGFEESFDAYLKIKLCSPGFILLAITTGIEFITNNAVEIALIMCIVFGGEITVGGNTVSSPSIAKGIQYLVNAKKNRRNESIESEYKQEQLKGIKLDNTKKENDILMQERDMKKLKESLDKLEKIRDKMEIRKGKGTKSYIKALNEVINELEKTL